MDFSELKDELAARGVDYLSDLRRGQYINWARAQLDASRLWPYRKSSAIGDAGTGTVTIADLGTPYLVQDTSNSSCPLSPVNEITLRGYGSVALTGSPWAYYVTMTGSSGTINAYPVGGTIQAFYYAVTADLSGPTDSPDAPAQYHGLIVDMAVQMAYRDSDDHQQAEQLQAWIDRQLAAMVDALFAFQPPTYLPTVAQDF